MQLDKHHVEIGLANSITYRLFNHCDFGRADFNFRKMDENTILKIRDQLRADIRKYKFKKGKIFKN